MNKEDLEKKITAAVEEYIADEETYDDNARVQIDPETWKVTMVDSDDESYGDVAGMDYYDVMDLVRMSVAEPGKWEPDREAIASVAEEELADRG